MQHKQIAADWWKWGEPSKRKSLDDYPKFKLHLEKLWNVSFHAKSKIVEPLSFNVDIEASAQIARLFSFEFPSLQISTDPEIRLKKSVGKSYPDLLHAAIGKAAQVLDAVLYPATHEDVLKVLGIASRNKIIVVPFGGGTNVVGAFAMSRQAGVSHVVLDLSNMNRILSIDEENHTATFQCGILGPALEETLNEKGFTLAHFPQSFEFSTLGGWIATRSAGQESSGYGRIEDMVISLKVATPSGTITTSGYEGDAEGINIKSLFFGSEGSLGVVTEAKLRIHKLPATKEWTAVLFPQFEDGLLGLKTVIQSGIFPSIIRYSDERETYLLSLLSRSKKSIATPLKSSLMKYYLKWKKLEKPCLMIIRIDGSKDECNVKQALALRILKKYKGVAIGKAPGIKWETTRFGLPYLQDDLIERGILVDIVETVLPWNRINDVKATLHKVLTSLEAFQKDKGILLAHISHVYDSCASIYFSMITARDVDDPYGQWQKIKTTAMDIIIANGGAASHHHSIGTDLRKWYLQRTCSLTKNLLQAIKKNLDPDHILNPGKLFDEQE